MRLIFERRRGEEGRGGMRNMKTEGRQEGWESGTEARRQPRDTYDRNERKKVEE